MHDSAVEGCPDDGGSGDEFILELDAEARERNERVVATRTVVVSV